MAVIADVDSAVGAEHVLLSAKVVNVLEAVRALLSLAEHWSLTYQS